jgi:hypothetical protein
LSDHPEQAASPQTISSSRLEYGALEPEEEGPARWAMLPLRIGLMAMVMGIMMVLIPVPIGGTDAHAFLLVTTVFEALCAAVAAVVITVRLVRHGAEAEPIVLAISGLIAVALVAPLASHGLDKIRRHAQRQFNYGPGFEKLEAFYDSLNHFATDHDGQFPDHVRELTLPGDLPNPFLSAWRHHGSNLSFQSLQPASVYRHGDFIFCYTGLGGTAAPPDSVLAFSARLGPTDRDLSRIGTGRHAPQIRLILFADGRTAAMPLYRFEQLMQRENQRRAKQFGLPAIRMSDFEPEEHQNMAV